MSGEWVLGEQWMRSRQERKSCVEQWYELAGQEISALGKWYRMRSGTQIATQEWYGLQVDTAGGKLSDDTILKDPIGSSTIRS